MSAQANRYVARCSKSSPIPHRLRFLRSVRLALHPARRFIQPILSAQESTTNVERFPDGIPGNDYRQAPDGIGVSAIMRFQKALHRFDGGVAAVVLDPFGIGFGHMGRYTERQQGR